MMFTTNDFKNFLRGNDQTLILSSNNGGLSLTKVNIENKGHRFYQIFFNPYVGNEKYLSIRDTKNFEHLIGFYDSQQDVFLAQGIYYMEWYLKDINTKEFQSVHDFIAQKEKELKGKILNAITQQYEFYLNLEQDYIENLSDYQVKILKESVRQLMIVDEEIQFTEKSITYHLTDSEIMALLTDETNTQKVLIANYLKENQNNISKQLQELAFKKQYANVLKKDNKFLKEKEIIQAVSNKEMKSIIVVYSLEEKEITFKLENRISISNPWLSSYNIMNKKEREIYDSLTSDPIDLQKIKEIRYGRKVIYKA